MKKRMIRIIATLLIGWLLYSMTGVIPMNMAIPLPEFLHTNITSLPDGYTDENKLLYDHDRPIVPAGTFDALGVTQSNNYLYDTYFDPINNTFSIYADGKTYRADATELDYTDTISENPCGVAIHVKNYEYLSRNFSMATRRGTLVETDGLIGTHLNIGDQVSPEDVTELLYAHQTEPITPAQLSALLTLYYDGELAGWFPEEKTAVFLQKNDRYAIIALDTHVVGEEYENAGEVFNTYLYYDRPALSHLFVTSPDTVIGYDETKKAIVEHTFSTGKNTVLADDIPTLKTLNVSLMQDAPVIGGIIDEHTAFLYDCADGAFTNYPLGEEFRADYFVFSDKQLVLMMHNGNGNFDLKRTAYIKEEASK